jgi:predicted dehydrogenase
MARLRVGVVGVGHLGKEHARILAGMPDVELVGVVDTNPDQARQIAQRFHCLPFPTPEYLYGRVDAACIVVPTVHHHRVAIEFLNRRIPLLIEKPLAATLNQANHLVTAARKNRVTLQVGHVERFNPAFEELRRRPIKPLFVECERHGTFTGRSTDIGAVLDLMIHDIDLLLDLIGAPVVAAEAVGISVFGGHEDMATSRLRFASGCVAHLTASRVSPNPKRRLRIWAPEGYAGIDFFNRRLTLVQPSENLRRQGLDVSKLDPLGRMRLKEELFNRHLQTLELDCNDGDQLTRELLEFVTCVRSGNDPRVNGEAGRDAVKVANQILESMKAHPWGGSDAGPVGPYDIPPPTGRLFDPPADDSAAAA